jgi:DNA-binding transcriptional MerR regulator
MIHHMKTLPQITIDFNDAKKSPEEADQGRNIGVRVKKLKEAPAPQSTGAESPVGENGKKIKSTRGRKSIRQVEAEADLIQIPEDEILFNKQYYSMGEVSEMFRVNQSLLRFWEAEFDILQPKKNKKGDRYFRPIDIKNLHLIYHLLRQRKYTIEGAKDFLKKNRKAEERFGMIRNLEQIKAFLLELKAQL